MGRGPYEPSLKRFVECVDNLEKDKPYTFEELEATCHQWHNTIRHYVSAQLSEVNLELQKTGKVIKPANITKQVCQQRTYLGLIVDPPQSVDGWFVGLCAMAFLVPFVTHAVLSQLSSRKERSRETATLKLVPISRYINCCGRRLLVKKGSSWRCTICGGIYFINTDGTVLSLRHVAD